MAKLWQFWKVTQNLHFQKKCKGETKRSFSKIAQKVALASKGQKHSGANVIILYIVFTYNAKTKEAFDAKSSSKTSRMTKKAKGGPTEIFQKSPKK